MGGGQPAAAAAGRPASERADSWATDAHKWLNVPYDCGLVFCADPQAHRAAMGARAGYLVHGAAGERDALDYNPEYSRRARGFAVYAALRALGRGGVAELVERCCALARRFAEQLGAAPGVEVLNDVVLNQVLVRFLAVGRRSDDLTRAVVDACPARRHLLDERHHVAGAGRDADLGVELVDRRGGRRPVGRGHPAVCAGGGLTGGRGREAQPRRSASRAASWVRERTSSLR